MSKDMKRREFLILAAAFASRQAVAKTPSAERTVDAGPASAYSRDGVYPSFRDQGFFVIRRGNELFALSALCTHRKCKLSSETDGSFSCKCHGSTFNPNGKVIEGPAARDLAVLSTLTSEKGDLLVRVPVT
jgi:cytochrome b6-f complex iron-sulfur subunit